MSLDLDFDPGQAAVAEAVGQFCADHCSDEVVRSASESFPRELWRGLAELGVLWAAAPNQEAGAVELCAAAEALGRAVFPGPLSATCVAVHALPEPERAAVAEGRRLVALSESAVVPWAGIADLFLERVGDIVFRAEPAGQVEGLETLAGDPWGRVPLQRGEALAASREALSLGEIVRAAYLAGAGHRLVEDAAQHAAVRRQFGRAIGEFQAVAHPLADVWIHLEAARGLARAAAWEFARGGEETAYRAAVARMSASRAALDAVHVGHQVFGAVGITLEGPVFHVSRRIRQLTSEPPSEALARSELRNRLGVGTASP
ncbi:MAG: acyl-CoA dehydrogenase family protein [Myxococcota bacterium]